MQLPRGLVTFVQVASGLARAMDEREEGQPEEGEPEADSTEPEA